jgi:hypothetical protein
MKLFTLTLFFIFLFQMAFTKTLKLGVVGYSREIFDPKEAQEAIKKLIPKMIEIHKPNHVELVSGLTNQGIPKLSYQFAVSKNFKTVGIAPEAAFRVPAGILLGKNLETKVKLSLITLMCSSDLEEDHNLEKKLKCSKKN